MDDEAELVTFCRRVYPRLVSVLTLHGGEVGVAEELAQETLVRVWARWTAVAKMDSAEAWAYRVALNLSTSGLRRRVAERRAVARASLRLENSEPDWADAIAIRAALGSLPSRQRAAVILRYYAGLSVSEVATAMRCAPGTVKALTSQGIAGLREHLATELEVEAIDNA